MRPNRDGKPVVPGNGGYDIEIVEVTGPPDRMMPMPPAKSRGKLVPLGSGEGLPPRPAPVRKKHSRMPLLPTANEIQKLPWPAQLAFAARCARRVFAAVRYFWMSAPSGHLSALESAVDVAEQSAFAADSRGRVYIDAVAAVAAEAAASAPDGATDAAYVAAVAVQTPSEVPTQAAGVIFETATIDTPLTAQLRCIRRDFVRLKRLAREQKWTDDTPVPPDVFGPMWPEGVAPYWAVEPPPAPTT